MTAAIRGRNGLLFFTRSLRLARDTFLLLSLARDLFDLIVRLGKASMGMEVVGAVTAIVTAGMAAAVAAGFAAATAAACD
jgi:hypothetical protein